MPSSSASCCLIRPVNDNAPHPLLADYLYWQEQVDGVRRYPHGLQWRPFGFSRERFLLNLISFYRFEIACRLAEREQLKQSLRTVKPLDGRPQGKPPSPP